MIGGGQMALALGEGFCRAGLLNANKIIVYEPQSAARERLAGRVTGICFASSAEAVQAARIVFLAVKPQQCPVACQQIASALSPTSVVVSIVAGVSTANLAALLGTRNIIRVMPNTPCLVGKGVSVVCHTPQVPIVDVDRVLALLGSVGFVHAVEESLMDAVTGLSGSGPGFLALMVEAFVEGGVRAGLPPHLAARTGCGNSRRNRCTFGTNRRAASTNPGTRFQSGWHDPRRTVRTRTIRSSHRPD